MSCGCHGKKAVAGFGDDTQADRDAAATEASDKLTGLLKFTMVGFAVLIALPFAQDLYYSVTKK